MRDRRRPAAPQPFYGAPGVVEPLGFVGDNDLPPFQPHVVASVMATRWQDATQFAPGSEEKQCVLYLRTREHLPLWVEGDRTDHVSKETRRELFAVSDEDEAEEWE
jgi:hypothetical protein